jgi:hypothetical protein
MQPDLQKTPVLHGCPNCHLEGWIFLDSHQTTVLVICPNCQHEIAYAYCPECDAITNFLARSEVRRPPSWKCPVCEKEYSLNPDFYEYPIRLNAEEQIPEAIQSNMRKRTARQLALVLAGFLLVLVLIIREIIF